MMTQNSLQLHYPVQTQISLATSQLCVQRQNTLDLRQYLNLVNFYQHQRFFPYHLSEESLEKHKIRYVNNEDSIIFKDQLKLKKTDCLFSIIKTQFNGLEYIYEILIGPFIMRILVLNLNRNSDDGDQDICKEQIGSGGFGSVRLVRIGDQQFAIKRIPFKFKLQQGFGYDLQAQNSEQYQLRRCLRQFCMFKICSLLGIGPKLVQSSYDIICFSNCVEFRMQLCESIASSQFYINHQELSLSQVKSDLQKKLIKLHSLHIVHRDIKPQNLLYSPQRKEIIFGDFGMNMIIKQSNTEKTLTKFAGTLNFCGGQMKQLINGQQGLVNLYLNDYCSLKETIKSLQSEVIKEDSALSRNNMSFDQSNYDNHSDFHNSSINQSSSTSLRNQTDISYISTQSIINFSTSSTEAPKKLGTAINHHQAQIISLLCRKLQQRKQLTKQTVFNYIQQNIDPNQNKSLIDNLVLEIASLFFQNKYNSSIFSKLKQWKNASRHYGPSSQWTIIILDKIIKQSQKDESDHARALAQNLVKIRQQVNCHQSSLGVSLTQMFYYRSLGHYDNYTTAFINYIRYQINMKDKRYSQNPESVFETVDFLIKQFLFCLKSSQITFKRVISIKMELFKYIYDQRIVGIQQLMKAKNIVKFSYFYLCRRKKLHFQDLACCIKLLLLDRKNQKSFIKNLMNKLELFSEEDKSNILIKYYLYHFSLQLSQKTPQSLNQLQKILEQIAEQMQKSKLKEIVLIQIQLMILYLNKKQHDKILIVHDQVLKGLQNSKEMLVNWHYFNILRLKIMGQCYLFINCKISQQYYKQALGQIQKNYGDYNRIEDSFLILNNLSLLYLERKDYRTSIKYLYDAKEVLQHTDRKPLLQKKIYVCQQIVIMKITKLGLQSDEDLTECIKIVKEIIVQVSKFFEPNGSCHFNQIVGALRQEMKLTDRCTIEKQIIKFMHKQERLKKIFMQMYLNLNLSVSQYLIKQMKMTQQGLKYLWNYIQLKNAYPKSIKQQDYSVFNMFSHYLMESNSFRRAVKFLKKYIFKIPTHYFAVKKKAFQLMHKACSNIDQKMTKMYYELIKNSCSLLTSKKYTALIAKEKNYKKKVLLEKWLLQI